MKRFILAAALTVTAALGTAGPADAQVVVRFGAGPVVYPYGGLGYPAGVAYGVTPYHAYPSYYPYSGYTLGRTYGLHPYPAYGYGGYHPGHYHSGYYGGYPGYRGGYPRGWRR